VACQDRYARRDLGENNGARRHPNHQDPEHESEIANARGDECFVGRICGGVTIKPVADQHIRGKAHQFPKDEQHDEIVREDDAKHREHEQRQCREIAGLAFVVPHVTQRIDVNDRSNTGNQNDHCLAQRIQQECERDAEHPAAVNPGRLRRRYLRSQEDQTTADEAYEHRSNRDKTA
jgi:hypothetical protein